MFSGGLDSSFLLRTYQILGFDIDTKYSTGYPFENYEREYAFSATEYFGTNNKYHEVSMPEYLRGSIETISASEQPFLHMQTALLHLLMRDGLPRYKDILLNGQGAELSCIGMNIRIYKFRKKSLVH